MNLGTQKCKHPYSRCSKRFMFHDRKSESFGRCSMMYPDCNSKKRWARRNWR
jgi:hypothetical protein